MIAHPNKVRIKINVFLNTPPTFYEVFILHKRKPHPTGCRRCALVLSRLRLGWAFFYRLN